MIVGKSGKTGVVRSTIKKFGGIQEGAESMALTRVLHIEDKEMNTK